MQDYKKINSEFVLSLKDNVFDVFEFPSSKNKKDFKKEFILKTFSINDEGKSQEKSKNIIFKSYLIINGVLVGEYIYQEQGMLSLLKKEIKKEIKNKSSINSFSFKTKEDAKKFEIFTCSEKAIYSINSSEKVYLSIYSHLYNIDNLKELSIVIDFHIEKFGYIKKIENRFIFECPNLIGIELHNKKLIDYQDLLNFIKNKK